MRAEHVEVRRGVYRDSVTLMQVSRSVTSAEGVEAATVAMATELNLELVAGMGFAVPVDAGPNDMVVAVRAVDEDAVRRGLAALDEALDRPARAATSGATDPGGPAPRTTGSALARLDGGPGARLALVSVPGRHAFVEAMDALDSGAHVMVFSDNVPVEQEVRLKDEAAAHELLVMGPDCGTALVGGIGLGFANLVRPGPVGIVAASGTGAQQLMCLLDGAGVGTSACLGVGGRDLSAAVGGRSTLQALALLERDPSTELIVVVSKPPAEEVAAAVEEVARVLPTPVVLAFVGPGRPDLSSVAEQVCARLGRPWEAPRSYPPAPREPDCDVLRRHAGVSPAKRHSEPAGGAGGAAGGRGALRGLFAGGTLCDEAMVIASAVFGPVRSNIPLRPEWALPDDLLASSPRSSPGSSPGSSHHGGHVMIDFGDDRLTQGRPHPMIDQSLRIGRLAAEAADPATAVILLDVVLGYGAHPDPAAELAPAIAAGRRLAADAGRELAVVVSLCGTYADPQGLERQAAALAAAGASVHLSNAAAARTAVHLLGAPS